MEYFVVWCGLVVKDISEDKIYILRAKADSSREELIKFVVDRDTRLCNRPLNVATLERYMEMDGLKGLGVTIQENWDI